MDGISTPWATFKSFVNTKNMWDRVQYFDYGGWYELYFFDNPMVVKAHVPKDETPSETQTDFEGTYKSKCNKNLSERMTSISAPMVSNVKPDIPSATIVSHDWSNKTTWYGKSVRVTGEELATSDNLTFTSEHAYWINLVSGLVYDEEAITGKNVVVKVDGVTVTSGFTINYVEGKVVFNEAVTGTVTVDYNYATESTYVLAPMSGKILIIEHSEIQFCKDVTVNAIIDFEIWAWHPDQVNNPGVKIMVNKLTYKNEKDIINSCNLGQGFIPRFGNLPDDVLVFPFNYITTKPLRYSQGAEVRIRIRGDEPFPGSFTTVTFYILSKNE